MPPLSVTNLTCQQITAAFGFDRNVPYARKERSPRVSKPCIDPEDEDVVNIPFHTNAHPAALEFLSIFCMSHFLPCFFDLAGRDDPLYSLHLELVLLIGMNDLCRHVVMSDKEHIFRETVIRLLCETKQPLEVRQLVTPRAFLAHVRALAFRFRALTYTLTIILILRQTLVVFPNPSLIPPASSFRPITLSPAELALVLPTARRASLIKTIEDIVLEAFIWIGPDAMGEASAVPSRIDPVLSSVICSVENQRERLLKTLRGFTADAPLGFSACCACPNFGSREDCEGPAVKNCACKTILICSRHQRAAWKSHKPYCFIAQF